MAKTRHDSPPSSNRGTLAIMIAGGLLVAALVVWALTRTVEPSTQSVMNDESTASTTMPAPSASSPDAGFISTAPTTTVAGQTAAPPPQPHGDRSSVKRIAVEDLRAKYDRGEVTVIDVRDASAYNAQHIPGALNIPFASIESMLDLIPKNKPIVTYCTWPAEESSAGAALILKEKGFNDVQALFGGFHAWTGLGYPTAKQ